MPSPGRAGANACRYAVLYSDGIIVDAIDAQGAFLHDAVAIVVLARTIGAGPGAQFAADAGVRIDQHNSVLGAFVGGPGRAHGDAIGLFAMQARARKIYGPAARTLTGLEGVHTIEPGAVRVIAVGILIGEGRGIAGAIPLLAARGARLATDAGIKVDDQTKLFAAAGG